MRADLLGGAAAFAAGALGAVLAAACGEPPVDLEIPARQPDAHVLDAAGILTDDALEAQLDVVAVDGLDVVAVAYETPQANCGEAFRAGGEVLDAWDADVAVVAVARPGDFTAAGEGRERCLGIRPRDEYAVPRSLREEIVEQLVPPLAADNRWDDAFAAAVSRLAEELT